MATSGWLQAHGDKRVATSARIQPDGYNKRIATTERLQANAHKRVAVTGWLQASGYNRVVTTEWLQTNGYNRVATIEWLQTSGYKVMAIAKLVSVRALRERERERERGCLAGELLLFASQIHVILADIFSPHCIGNAEKKSPDARAMVVDTKSKEQPR